MTTTSSFYVKLMATLIISTNYMFNSNCFIAITTTSPDLENAARQLAADLKLPYVDGLDQTTFHYLLVYTPEYLGLQNTAEKRFQPFYINFLSGKMHYRSQQAGLRNELLARALGCKPSEKLTIVDATAGLGRDSYILASLGFDVIMLERAAILHALLRNALQRIQNQPAYSHLTLIHANAIEWLPKAPPPDIIYLDPMFPARKKSASVKKEMVILQDLLGKDMDSAELFEVALSCAKKRVVVKRPKLAENIGERAPNYTIAGKSSRFDIYLT